MNKIKSLLLYSAAAVFALTSCDDDDDDDNGGNNDTSGNIIKTGEITSDETWSTGNVYELDGRVTVTGGATLTIEPGVIIKGQAGSAANASALLIARDGMIMAEGTAAEPIIMTSVADEIEPGMISSPNLDPGLSGFWGGLIVLGEAPISASQSPIQIEGIPVSDQNGLYGGSDAADNSGVIRYVSVRHGGSNIGAGNEINGITLGGVGTGTVIENVEVVANQDDGIEWFGGTVNVTNALVWNAGDDGMDTDQDWIGTCDNFLVVNAGDSSFELDGPEGSSASGNNHRFTNGTVFLGGSNSPLDVDDDTNVDIDGVYFFGFNNPGQEAEDVDENSNSFINFEYTFPATYDDDDDGDTPEVPWTVAATDVFVGVPAAELSEVSANGNTVGPQSQAGFEWTWASTSGALSGLGL